VENTERDPSTAWQTSAGEWRLTNYEGKIFSSTDFVKWSRPEDGATPFPVAECPDFFPVPAACTGTGCDLPAPPGFAPTHVHKHSDGGDWYTFGAYEEGAAGTSGTWTAYPADSGDARGLPLDASQVMPVGGMNFYASKSFFDPVGAGRRIYWGWALVPPASTQTLPRVTTYHAALKRLIFTPAPELSALRGAVLFSLPTVTLAPNSTAPLSAGWAPGAGNTSEAAFSFTLPAARATFGLNVMGDRAAAAVSSLTFSWDPVNRTAAVAWVAGGGPSPGDPYYMPGVDMPGGDFNVTNVSYDDPRICQAACNQTKECKAFTYVVRPPLKGSCCLKNTVPDEVASPTCTSGVKPGGPGPAVRGAAIPMLPADVAIDVRVFVDNTFAEVFVMQGRLAITLKFDKNPIKDAAMELFAGPGAAATATDVNVWAVKPIWTSVDEVLAAAHST
jgi:sucrose-6-phosphate hydrolase SacC (GH32 family)